MIKANHLMEINKLILAITVTQSQSPYENK